MATIIKTSYGTFKAVIRGADGAYLKSKPFTRKGDATAWAKRIEADREHVEALGTEGPRRTLNELADLHFNSPSARVRRHPTRSGASPSGRSTTATSRT